MLGILGPRVDGPFELDLSDIFESRIGELLLVVLGRPQADTKVIGRLDEQCVPPQQVGSLQGAVVRNQGVHDIAELDPTARIQVSRQGKSEPQDSCFTEKKNAHWNDCSNSLGQSLMEPVIMRK